MACSASAALRASSSGTGTVMSRPFLRAELSVGVNDASGLVTIIQPTIDAQAAVTLEEGSQRIGLIAEHRHAIRFQHLECIRQIEEGFGARADNGDRCAPQLGQISGDIEGFATVDATDAACGEDRDARRVGGHHRCSNCCRAIATARDDRRKVASAAFLDAARRRLGEAFLFGCADADGELPAQDGDGGGGSAGGADGRFHAKRSLQALWHRQAMGEHIGLQRDDGATFGQGGSNLLVNVQCGAVHGLNLLSTLSFGILG